MALAIWVVGILAALIGLALYPVLLASDSWWISVLPQVVAGLAIVPVLLAIYWRFRWNFYRFTIAYLGLVLILALLYALVYAQLGVGLGIPYLFWDESFRLRTIASLGATLLLGLLGIIAYYLDPYPLATHDRVTGPWLEADEAIKARVSAWWGRRLGGLAGSRRGVVEAPSVPIRPLDLVGFAINAVLLDWASVTPWQRAFEPRTPNTARLQRFLRTCRAPFLTLLMAPAILPAFFAAVPRGGATGGPATWRLGAGASDLARTIDGILAWQLGILLGVLTIKAMLRLADRFYKEKPPARVEVMLAAPLEGCARGAACPAAGCPFGPSMVDRRPPADCRARRHIRRSIVTFFGIALAVYVAMGNLPILYRSFVSPAVAICAALGIMALVYALIVFQPRRWQLPLIVAIVAWLGWANNDPYKNRFEEMSYDRPKLVPLRDRVDAAYFADALLPGMVASDPDLIPDREALGLWLAGAGAGNDRVGGKPKLVVTAVSGGASRSAYWTATVLERLEREIPGFGDRVRIIAGASGGMLGTACYVAHRRNEVLGIPEVDAETGRPISWVDAVPVQGLTPLAKYIALVEIWHALAPLPTALDRGIVLERAWEPHRYPWTSLRFPLRELRPLERIGRVPSLIFSPMIVDDGRRLLISNLDLSQMDEGPVSLLLKSRGGSIGGNVRTDGSAGDRINDYSLSAIEFYRIFPEAKGLKVSTAVRMSASFPYLSPAVNLPSRPPRRIVDAGYYDNYGVQVAASWIYQNFDWLAENTSGVLLLQIRDAVSVEERLDVDDTPPSWWDRATRGFEFLTSPIDGALAARSSSSSFRNDKDVQFLSDLFAARMAGKVARPRQFFTTAAFENSATVTLHDEPPGSWPGDDLERAGPKPGPGDVGTEVAMSWHLTAAEIRAMRRAIPADPAPGSPWADPEARGRHMDLLKDAVYGPDPAPGEDRPGTPIASRPRPPSPKPGPERTLRFKQLERVRNFERLVNLAEWWRTAGEPAGAKGR